jgi:hypothetical protein
MSLSNLFQSPSSSRPVTTLFLPPSSPLSSPHQDLNLRSMSSRSSTLVQLLPPMVVVVRVVNMSTSTSRHLPLKIHWHSRVADMSTSSNHHHPSQIHRCRGPDPLMLQSYWHIASSNHHRPLEDSSNWRIRSTDAPGYWHSHIVQSLSPLEDPSMWRRRSADVLGLLARPPHPAIIVPQSFIDIEDNIR